MAESGDSDCVGAGPFMRDIHGEEMLPRVQEFPEIGETLRGPAPATVEELQRENARLRRFAKQ